MAWFLRSSKKFYSCTIESIRTICITTWYGNCSASDHKALHRVVRTAQYITEAKLPAVQDLYTRRCQRKSLTPVTQVIDSSLCYRTVSGTGARLVQTVAQRSKRSSSELNTPHHSTSGVFVWGYNINVCSWGTRGELKVVSYVIKVLGTGCCSITVLTYLIEMLKGMVVS